MSDLENFCADKLDGNYPHPSGDPTKVITCVAQTHAYERECPPGYIFDADLGTCVAPDGSTARPG
jgi:hypothetical protein